MRSPCSALWQTRMPWLMNMAISNILWDVGLSCWKRRLISALKCMPKKYLNLCLLCVLEPCQLFWTLSMTVRLWVLFIQRWRLHTTILLCWRPTHNQNRRWELPEPSRSKPRYNLTPVILSLKWNIGLEAGKWTLSRVTTQRGIKSVIDPLIVRPQGTNYWSMRYKRLEPDLFTNYMFANMPSTHGNNGGQKSIQII